MADAGKPFSRMFREGGSPAPGAWKAAEKALDDFIENDEPCLKGTAGCSVKHPTGPETECETW